MAKVQDYGDTINARLDTIIEKADDVAGDVTWLKEQIAQLDTDELSPADQAIMDGIVVRLDEVAEKVGTLAAATTPPTP